MPKELEEQLMELEWPPVVEFPTEKEGETRPVTLTELDVNWILCTVLGMKWSDATGVGNNPYSVSFMSSTNFVCSNTLPFCIIPDFGKVSKNDIESSRSES